MGMPSSLIAEPVDNIITERTWPIYYYIIGAVIIVLLGILYNRMDTPPEEPVVAAPVRPVQLVYTPADTTKDTVPPVKPIEPVKPDWKSRSYLPRDTEYPFFYSNHIS